jgi:hypothetical protein
LYPKVPTLSWYKNIHLLLLLITVAPFQVYAFLELLEVIFEIICRTGSNLAYFQQHRRNDGFISVIFSSEKKKIKGGQIRQERREGGITATFLVAKNCCADKAVCTSTRPRSNNQS